MVGTGRCVLGGRGCGAPEILLHAKYLAGCVPPCRWPLSLWHSPAAGPSGFLATLELSETVRDLAAAAGNLPATLDLETKARRYVHPLLAAMRAGAPDE